MAKATYWQRGESLDYINSGDTKIEYNTVIILGKRVGIAGGDILPGEKGSLHVEGVFEFDKADDTAINAGTPVYWLPDSTAPGITASADDGEDTPTAYVPVGYAVETAAAASTKIKVKINA